MRVHKAHKKWGNCSKHFYLWPLLHWVSDLLSLLTPWGAIMVCAEGETLDFWQSTSLEKDTLRRWVEMESCSCISKYILLISNVGECYLR